jgi:hypothetical protein
MKFYEVECRAVITLAEEDMENAALHVAALFKDNPNQIHVRAVHEKNVEPVWKDPGSENSQQDSVLATLEPAPSF